MGLIRDTLLLRQYLRAKSLSNLIDELEEGDDKPKKGRKSKRIQKEENAEHHLGFWDFLDKQIQEEKKEAADNPTSFKDLLKYMGLLLLFGFVLIFVGWLLGVFIQWLNSIAPFNA